MSDADPAAFSASMPFAELVCPAFVCAEKARVSATVAVGADHCSAGSMAVS